MNGAGKLVTNDMEKAEVLSAFFASVSTSKTSLQEFRPLRPEGKSGTSVVEGPDQGALKLEVREPDRLHP